MVDNYKVRSVDLKPGHLCYWRNANVLSVIVSKKLLSRKDSKGRTVFWEVTTLRDNKLHVMIFNELYSQGWIDIYELP